jgi:hypothetical protein
VSAAQAPGAPARRLPDAQLLEQAIKGLQDLQHVLDSIGDGALPPEFWLDARMAFADAAAYRENEAQCDDDAEDAALRERYLRHLDVLGGHPDPWPSSPSGGP